MAPFLRSRKDILSIEDLEKVEDKKCGSKIDLHQVPQNLFPKLFYIVNLVQLKKIVLRNTFADAKWLTQLLSTIGLNKAIKKGLDLDVRDNPFDKKCGEELAKLISRNLFEKLELPPIKDPSCCEDILREILSCGRKIAVLNISGSVLTGSSIDFLESLIRECLVTDQLVLRNCTAHGHNLTEDDHDKLKDAEKQTKRWFATLKILWFDYVESAELDIENLDPHKYEIVKLPPPPIYMPTKPGAIAKMVFFMVKEKKKSAWKFVRGRKRRHEATSSSKVRIQEAEIDEITNLMDKPTFEQEQRKVIHSYECSEAPNDAGPMSLGASTSSPVMAEEPQSSANVCLQGRTGRPGNATNDFLPSQRNRVSSVHSASFQRVPSTASIGIQADEPPTSPYSPSDFLPHEHATTSRLSTPYLPGVPHITITVNSEAKQTAPITQNQDVIVDSVNEQNPLEARTVSRQPQRESKSQDKRIIKQARRKKSQKHDGDVANFNNEIKSCPGPAVSPEVRYRVNQIEQNNVNWGKNTAETKRKTYV